MGEEPSVSMLRVVCLALGWRCGCGSRNWMSHASTSRERLEWWMEKVVEVVLCRVVEGFLDRC